MPNFIVSALSPLAINAQTQVQAPNVQDAINKATSLHRQGLLSWNFGGSPVTAFKGIIGQSWAIPGAGQNFAVSLTATIVIGAQIEVNTKDKDDAVALVQSMQPQGRLIWSYESITVSRYLGPIQTIWAVPAPRTPTTTTLIAEPTETVIENTIQATAIVQPGVTGTVQFFDGAIPLGTEAVDATTGRAVLPNLNLAVGTHVLTAQYSGDENFAPSTSNPVTVLVDKAPTLTVLTAIPTNTTPGSSIQLLAKVVSSQGLPTGTVNFYDGSSPIESLPLNIPSGIAYVPALFLSTGTHLIDAIYNGDSNFLASTAIPVTVTIQTNLVTTSISFSASPSTSVSLVPVTLTATVVPADGNPNISGQVTWTATYGGGAVMFGPAALVNNVATVVINPFVEAAPYISMEAHYLGSGDYLPSDSAPQNVGPYGAQTHPFAGISDMYFNPATNLMWVADPGSTTLLPVLEVDSYGTFTTIDLSGVWNAANLGSVLAVDPADDTYIVVAGGNPRRLFVIIEQATFTIVGLIDTTYTTTSGTFSPFSIRQGCMVVHNGFVYLAADGNPNNPEIQANILKFSIADAIASYPTPTTAVDINVEQTTWPSGSPPNRNWGAQVLAYDPVSGHLFVGSDQSQSGFSGYEALFEVDPIGANIPTLSSTTFTSVGQFFYRVSTSPGDVWFSVFGAGNGNPTFNGSPAAIWANHLPVITLPNSGIFTSQIYQEIEFVYDPYGNTICVYPLTTGLTNAYIIRYGTSGDLLSFFTPSSSIFLNSVQIRAVQSTSNSTIWLGWLESGGFNGITVFSSGIGTEAPVKQIPQF